MQASLFDAGQREEFLKRLREGWKGDCPCCRRHAQIYKRTLHFVTAWQLIRLYKLNGYGDYVNACELIFGRQQGVGDFSKAKYWDLIERRPPTAGDSDTQKSSGFWRLTDLGVNFVLRKVTIKQTVLIFDDKVLGFSGKDITMSQALRQRFDYEKLMTS